MSKDAKDTTAPLMPVLRYLIPLMALAFLLILLIRERPLGTSAAPPDPSVPPAEPVRRVRTPR